MCGGETCKAFDLISHCVIMAFLRQKLDHGMLTESANDSPLVHPQIPNLRLDDVAVTPCLRTLLQKLSIVAVIPSFSSAQNVLGFSCKMAQL